MEYSNSTTNSAAANSSPVPPWIEYEGELRAWTAVTLLICGLGGVGYALLLYVLHYLKTYRKPFGVLLIHLVVIDMLLCVWHIPLNILNTFLGHIGAFPVRYCYLSFFPFRLLTHVDNWCSMCLAINRFVALAFPYAHKDWVGKRAVVGMLAFTWIFSLAVCVPRFGFGLWGIYFLQPPWGDCRYVMTTTKVLEPVLLIFPMVTFTILYLATYIVTACTHQSNVVGDKNSEIQRKKFGRNARVARTLFATAVWYDICFVPMNVLGSTTLPAFLRSAAGLQFWFRTIYACAYAFTPANFFALSQEYRGVLKKQWNRIMGQREDLPEGLRQDTSHTAKTAT